MMDILKKPEGRVAPGSPTAAPEYPISILADDSRMYVRGKERCERWVWLAGLVALLSNPMAKGEEPSASNIIMN